MAEISKTSVEIEDLFRLIVCTILGLDTETTNERIRFPWGSHLPAAVGSAPYWNREEDILFIYALPHDDPYNRPRDRHYVDRGDAGLVQLEEHTDVHEVLFVNYGPNAYETARNIRNGLYRNDIRVLMQRNHFSLVTDVPAPRRVPELMDGAWWNRVDLSAVFNELVRKEYEAGTLESIRFDVSFTNRVGDVNGGADELHETE